MNRTRLNYIQKQVAKCSDELLLMSSIIENNIIPAFKASDDVCQIQCQVQLEKCRRMMIRLNNFEAELSTGFCNEDVSITVSIIEQDYALLLQKEQLLRKILDGSYQTEYSLKEASKMEDAERLVSFQNKLLLEKNVKGGDDE